MRVVAFVLSLFFCLGQPLLSFDHTHKEWDKLLKLYVSNGRVNYKKWKNEQTELKKYLESLSRVTLEEYKKFTTPQKLAFLINAYNAFTIQLILENYPVSGIRKIGGWFQSPWKIKFFELLGEKQNLDWIEHSKLRVEFNEPRIHFAIVCASIGCPILQSEAYSSDKLDLQLEKATQEFLKDKSKNYYDSSQKILYLSPIFKWFRSDFERKGSIIQFLKPYFLGELSENTKIE
ncbi:MAG: DUF547 domain-containing protein, partial [Leptospiraceae bacterium]|nr:DUF547 domain-containing protein [Leptospiraceae bacterium]